jgi:hypothetical protein
MNPNELIRLAENETLREFLDNEIKDIVDDLTGREPENSQAYTEWCTALVSRMYTLRMLTSDLEEAARHARAEKKRTQ